MFKSYVYLVGANLPYGRMEDVLSRSPNPINCHTSDDRKAWFVIDLGVNIIPNAYTLRHSRGYGRSALRNWLLQVFVETGFFVQSSRHTVTGFATFFRILSRFPKMALLGQRFIRTRMIRLLSIPVRRILGLFPLMKVLKSLVLHFYYL